MDRARSAPAPRRSRAFPSGEIERELAEGRALVLRVLRAQFPSVQREQAEEIAQELLIAFWHQRDRIRIPAAWFYTAARSRGINAVTRRRASLPLDALRGAEQPLARAPDERSEILRRLFFTLQSRCRKVLGSLVLSGWTLREVAEAAGCSIRQVNEQRSRCLKLLRRRWLDAESRRDEA